MKRIDAAGKDVARGTYWKLYAIENVIRAIVHSVLIIQGGPNWWKNTVDVAIRDRVDKLKLNYASQPWHSLPGKHDLYFVMLSDLAKILLTNANLVRPLIPDIDQWVVRIDQIRVPRNIVGHMNWPHKADRKRIDDLYSDLGSLLRQLATSRVAITIP